MTHPSPSFCWLVLALCLPGCSTKQADTAKTASDLRLKANEAVGKKDFEAAIDLSSQALELEPKNVDALWLRGLARLNTKDYQKAEEDLTQAIKLDADYAPAYRERGSVYLAQANYDAAISDATTFLRMRRATRMA